MRQLQTQPRPHSVFLLVAACPKLMTAAATEYTAYYRANISSTPVAKGSLAGLLQAVLIVTCKLIIPQARATPRFQFLCAAVTKPPASTSSTRALRAIHSVVLFWATFPPVG